ncbi:hypothetical protein GPALN_003236 [Globodera pallida]|nr:hypothetical protein GPALN_003236 [Globodera pallida]
MAHNANSLDAANLRAIYSEQFEVPQFDDSVDTAAQLVGRWLYTPRGDHSPKMVRCPLDEKVLKDLQEEFVDAIHPVTYILRLEIPPSIINGIEPFVLENDSTQEQLALNAPTKLFGCWYDARLGKTTMSNHEWETEAITWTWEGKNRITIIFPDNSVAEGIIDEDHAGP